MSHRKLYVIGFMFSDDGKAVVLIKKKRPEWQRGLLNGPGGHVEALEPPDKAVAREFFEETGVRWDGWTLFCLMEGEDFCCWCYKAFSTESVWAARTTTDEQVKIAEAAALPEACVPEIRWLVPLALQDKGGPRLTIARW